VRYALRNTGVASSRRHIEDGERAVHGIETHVGLPARFAYRLEP